MSGKRVLELLVAIQQQSEAVQDSVHDTARSLGVLCGDVENLLADHRSGKRANSGVAKETPALSPPTYEVMLVAPQPQSYSEKEDASSEPQPKPQKGNETEPQPAKGSTEPEP